MEPNIHHTPISSHPPINDCVHLASEYASALVSAPLISSVTSLSLNVSSDPFLHQEIAPGNSLHLALQNENTLPQLTALVFDGRWISNLILQHRLIEKIRITPWLYPVALCQAALWSTIATSPGNPKALFADDALQWLPDIISCPEKFHYLGIIGLFSFPRGRDKKVLRKIAPLASLPHLHTVCVDRTRNNETEHLPGDDITPRFIYLLGQELPTIEKVLVDSWGRRVNRPGPVLWERCEEGWATFQKRSNPVSYQDLVKDRATLRPESPQGTCCHDIPMGVTQRLELRTNGG